MSENPVYPYMRNPAKNIDNIEKEFYSNVEEFDLQFKEFRYRLKNTINDIRDRMQEILDFPPSKYKAHNEEVDNLIILNNKALVLLEYRMP